MEIITDKNKIYEAGMSSAVIHHLLSMVKKGQITFEDAMIAGVYILNKQNEELKKDIENMVFNSIRKF